MIDRTGVVRVFVAFTTLSWAAACLVGSDAPRPAVSLGGDREVTEGEIVTLDVTPDAAVRYVWDLGDGTTTETDVPVVTTAWYDEGSYEASVTAVDASGQSATTTARITVTNVAPTVSATVASEWSAGYPVTLQLDVADPGLNDAHAFVVDWGDGTADSGSLRQRQQALEHVFATSGAFQIGIAVTDDAGDTATETRDIQIVEANTIFVSAQTPRWIVPDVPLHGFVSGRDLYGLPLSVVLDDGPAGLTLDPANGEVAWPTPSAGLHDVSVTVTDGVVSQPYTFTLHVRDVRWIDAQTVGAAGGVLQDTNENSPLFGARLDIPAGALSDETEIRIGEVLDAPASERAAGPVLEVAPSGLRLAVPASLTLPYDATAVASDDVSVSTFMTGDWIYDTDDDVWVPEPTITVDADNGLITAQIVSFSGKGAQTLPTGRQHYPVLHFDIYYYLSGDDAVMVDCSSSVLAGCYERQLTLLPNDPDVPDYIEDLGETLIAAYNYFDDQNYILSGWSGAFLRHNVYVEKMDDFGQATAFNNLRITNTLEDATPDNRGPLTASLQQTAVHELFHIVQSYAYGFGYPLSLETGRSEWIAEGTATQMEIEVYWSMLAQEPPSKPYRDHYRHDKPTLLQGNAIYEDVGLGEVGYATFPVFLYLKHRYGLDIARDLYSEGTRLVRNDPRYFAWGNDLGVSPAHWFYTYVDEQLGDGDPDTFDEMAAVWLDFGREYHYEQDGAYFPYIDGWNGSWTGDQHPMVVELHKPTGFERGGEADPQAPDPSDPYTMRTVGVAGVADMRPGGVATFFLDTAHVLCAPPDGEDCNGSKAINLERGQLVFEIDAPDSVVADVYRAQPGSSPQHLKSVDPPHVGEVRVRLQQLQEGDHVIIVLARNPSDGLGYVPFSGPTVTPATIKAYFVSDQVVFVRQSGQTGFGDLWVSNLDGTGEKQITFANGYHWCPAMSPGADLVAFNTWNTSLSAYEIHIAGVDGTGEYVIPQSVGGERFKGCPMWTPDGSALIYGRANDGMVRYDIATGSEAIVSSAYCYQGDLHPDETKILCSDPVGGQYKLRILTLGGGLTDFADGHCGRYSPDGESIAYVSNWDLARMDADGSNAVLLTTNGTFRSCVDWDHDAQSLVFTGESAGPDYYYGVFRFHLDGSGTDHVAGLPYGDPDYWADWMPSM